MLTVACVLLISTVGAAATVSSTQIGHSPIYSFDVKDNAGKVVGRVIVNTANAQPPTYVLVANGLVANTKYTFGYTVSGVMHTLGSRNTTATGALVMHGTFPAADVKDLQSAQFGVTQSLPGSGGCEGYLDIRGFDLANDGWFLAKIACDYSTDCGATWHRSSSSGGISLGQHKTVDLGTLGVPNNALVKIYVVVVAGKSKEDIWPFQYVSGDTHYAYYWIDGTTLSNTLYYSGWY